MLCIRIKFHVLAFQYFFLDMKNIFIGRLLLADFCTKVLKSAFSKYFSRQKCHSWIQVVFLDSVQLKAGWRVYKHFYVDKFVEVKY